jgi:hypothetical protein
VIDHATQLRQQFIQGVDQITREQQTLETRRYLAQQYLRRRGLYFIEGGERPKWGEPDPRYAEGA